MAAVEEGRRIFDNIRKFTNYLLSTSLGEVFVVLALSIAGYFPLSATMLLWVNVVTDLVPASALAADPAVPQVMQRRPRRHDEPLLEQGDLRHDCRQHIPHADCLMYAGCGSGCCCGCRWVMSGSLTAEARRKAMYGLAERRAWRRRACQRRHSQVR